MTPRLPRSPRARRRHGIDSPAFYEPALSAAEREGLEEARAVRGLEDEVALLRLRLRDALERRPEDFEVLLSGMRLLIQALLAQRRLSGAQAEDLSESVLRLAETVGESLRGDLDAGE